MLLREGPQALTKCYGASGPITNRMLRKRSIRPVKSFAFNLKGAEGPVTKGRKARR